MDVKDLRYEFSCLKCPIVVTGTLGVERHGWVDVVIVPSQPVVVSGHSQGLETAPVEKGPDG
jgi:hypothetical protein